MDKTRVTVDGETAGGVYHLAQEALNAAINRISSGDLRGVQVALATPLYAGSGPGSHYHARPELFLQVSGTSVMKLTTGLVHNHAGGILLIPRGVAHQETADSTRSPFCNLVFMYGSGQLQYHAGLPTPGGTSPLTSIRVGGSCTVAHAFGRRLHGYLSEAAEFVSGGHAVQHPVVQGLLLSHLGLLRSLAQQRDVRVGGPESALVARCRRLVQEQLADSRLSVRHLAGQLRCTPDYLSSRFRGESGMRLIAHINQERCNLARHLLHTTPWSIKEIATRCGYADAGYFSRVFSQVEGAAPREFRAAEVRREDGGPPL